MKQEIDVIIQDYEREKIQDLMEDAIIQIIVNRINEYPDQERIYVYNKILESLKSNNI